MTLYTLPETESDHDFSVPAWTSELVKFGRPRIPSRHSKLWSLPFVSIVSATSIPKIIQTDNHPHKDQIREPARIALRGPSAPSRPLTSDNSFLTKFGVKIDWKSIEGAPKIVCEFKWFWWFLAKKKKSGPIIFFLIGPDFFVFAKNHQNHLNSHTIFGAKNHTYSVDF